MYSSQYIPIENYKYQPLNHKPLLKPFKQQPHFTVIIPSTKVKPALLWRSIDSLRGQWYAHWELILIDDACSLVKNDCDARIKMISPPHQPGISAALNAGVERAMGNYVVFLTPGDELTPNCLDALLHCINENNPDFIYSDEDQRTTKGKYTAPHFKPCWSPDTLMSFMYIGHVTCVRLALIHDLGGFRSEFDGHSYWDFVLRLAERTDKISHIPQILYHAQTSSSKPVTDQVAKMVRESALARRNLSGTVECLPGHQGWFRVNYAIQNNPLISIIIPSKDNYKILARCIESILSLSAYKHFEIILMDNGSTQRETCDYLAALATIKQLKVIRHDIPFNFSELCNVGVTHAAGDLLLFLNDDTEVLQTDWLERMAGYAQLRHVGAVGAKLIYPNLRKVQHGGVIYLKNGPSHAFLKQHKNEAGYFLRNQIEYNWLAVTAACLMVEKTKFEQIGGFDELFPIAYNDIDFCFRLKKAGYHQVMCPSVMLVHHESISRGCDLLSKEKLMRLAEELSKLNTKHPEFNRSDPYFNVNFEPNAFNFDWIRTSAL